MVIFDQHEMFELVKDKTIEFLLKLDAEYLFPLKVKVRRFLKNNPQCYKALALIVAYAFAILVILYVILN